MQRMPMIVLSVALAGAGCSTAAHIERYDGTWVDGRIAGGDRDTLWIDVGGQRVDVARDDIVDIDHPGNVAMVIGGIGATYFGALAVMGTAGYMNAASDPSDEPLEQLVAETGSAHIASLGVAGLALTLPPLIWGAVTWNGSMDAAAAPAGPTTTLHFTPTGVLVRF